MIKCLSSPRMTENIRSESGNGKSWDMMIEKMDKVVVLLSTYNGEKFLEEQLRSLQGQIGVDVTVLVRDDGSTDNTHAILDEWSKNGFLSWYTGPNLGPAKSFLDLLCNAPDADYYAFCDQDDVWLSDKLHRGVQALRSCNGDYKLYFTPAILVDSSLNIIGELPLNYKFTMGEAVVTNPATGCTMLFNSNLKKLVAMYPPQVIGMHDEWVYKVCLFMNGTIYADKESRIYYRQHGNNVVGAKEPFLKGFARHFALLFAKGGSRSGALCEIYRQYKSIMPKENADILETVHAYATSWSGRLGLLGVPGLSAPSSLTMFKFYMAVLFGKF